MITIKITVDRGPYTLTCWDYYQEKDLRLLCQEEEKKKNGRRKRRRNGIR